MSILPWILAVFLPACDLCFSCESILGPGKGRVMVEAVLSHPSSIHNPLTLSHDHTIMAHRPSFSSIYYLLSTSINKYPYRFHPSACFKPSFSIKNHPLKQHTQTISSSNTKTCQQPNIQIHISKCHGLTEVGPAGVPTGARPTGIRPVEEFGIKNPTLRRLGG